MAYESNNNQNADRYVSRVGTFRCTVLPTPNGIFSESKEGTPCIALPLEVTELGDQLGRRITWRGWLTAGAFDYTIKALSKTFGWDGDMEAIRDNPEFFSRMDCQIVTESETYNGELRVKVKWLNSPGGGGGKKIDAGKLDSILSTLGRKAKAVAKAALSEEGAAPSQTQAPVRQQPHHEAKANGYQPQPVIEDDDLPFN
jgi:hypothetical protein